MEVQEKPKKPYGVAQTSPRLLTVSLKTISRLTVTFSSVVLTDIGGTIKLLCTCRVLLHSRLLNIIKKYVIFPGEKRERSTPLYGIYGKVPLDRVLSGKTLAYVADTLNVLYNVSAN